MGDGRYNARVKYFSDGTVQTSLFPFSRNEDKSELVDVPLTPWEHKEPIYCQVVKHRLYDGDSPPPIQDFIRKRGKRVDNKAQSVERIFDYCRENEGKWFVTLTFAPWACNRYDYDECLKVVQRFVRKLRRMDIRYVLVPERHQDGAIHFHGVLFDDLSVHRAIHPRTGMPMVDRWGREVYNIPCYTWGFSTASKPDSVAKVAHYISSYITKCVDWLPKGKNCYLCSKSLLKPVTVHENVSWQDIIEKKGQISFYRAFPSPVGTYFFFEEGRSGNSEVNKIKSLPESASAPEPVGWIDVYDELEEAAPY